MAKEKIQKAKDFFLATIPEKLTQALKEYDTFSAQCAPMDAKSFGAFHMACKSALSHIVLLMKMLQLVENGAQDQSDTDWLAKAKSAIYETEDEGDDE